MSLPDPRHALEEWDARLRAIDDRLLDLESGPAYKLAAAANLTGKTLERARPLFDAVAFLFAARTEMARILEEARQAFAERASSPFWARGAYDETLRTLLFGASVDAPKLARSTPPRDVQLVAATLRVSSPTTLTALLDEMERVYAFAREGFEPLARAWERAATALDDVERGLAEGPVAGGAELHAIVLQIETLRAHALADPLGVASEVNDVVRPRLEALRAGAVRRARDAATLRTLAPHVERVLADLEAAWRRSILHTPSVGMALRRHAEAGRTLLESVRDGARAAGAREAAEKWLSAADDALAEATHAARERQGLVARLGIAKAEVDMVRAHATNGHAARLDALVRATEAALAEPPRGAARRGGATEEQRAGHLLAALEAALIAVRRGG